MDEKTLFMIFLLGNLGFMFTEARSANGNPRKHRSALIHFGFAVIFAALLFQSIVSA